MNQPVRVRSQIPAVVPGTSTAPEPAPASTLPAVVPAAAPEPNTLPAPRSAAAPDSFSFGNWPWRVDFGAAFVVEHGIKVQTVEGTFRAAQFLYSNQIPFEVALRVLTRPSQRRLRFAKNKLYVYGGPPVVFVRSQARLALSGVERLRQNRQTMLEVRPPQQGKLK